MNYLGKLTSKLRRDGLIATIIAILTYPFLAHKRQQYQLMLEKTSVSDRFNEIYEKNLWSSKESGSGRGSELAYTESLRKWLVQKVSDLDVKVFVDAPCGDFNWMKEVVPKTSFNYIGIDIVSSVIDANIEKYRSERVGFFTANICEDTLPKCDLIMVRDCLFHLSYDDIDRFLKNLSGVDYKYLLTTTHKVDEDFVNEDIITGDFRLIDLFADPFCFDHSKVFDRIDDHPAGHSSPRQMILIEKQFVPRSIMGDSMPFVSKGRQS